jgi:hypothetical protein
MNARLERILVKLAKQHAPHLVPPGWEQTNPDQRLGDLARRLASYNVLVMIGHVPPDLVSAKETHIQSWVNEYGHLYSLLAHNLFPSYITISAQYADDQLPAIIVVRGASTPIMHMLAGFIAPYIAARQPQPVGSEAELHGIMALVLDELEADDLPPAQFRRLRLEGAAILRRLLTTPVRQIGLTPFERPLFFPNPQPAVAAPAKLPEAPPASPPPPPPTFELPELDEEPEAPPTPTEQLFKTTIPMRSDSQPGSAPKRRLPVPKLPDEDKK